MGYKMRGSKFYGKGNQSPLKQDYKVLDDKELEESRNRLNARADAIEQIVNERNIKGQAVSDMRIMKKGDKLGPTPSLVINKNEPGKLHPWAKKIKKKYKTKG